MSSVAQANVDTSASNWGIGGFVAGTAVAVGATVTGGVPITALVCTQCLVTGITAGVAAFVLKTAKKTEEATERGKQVLADKAKDLVEKAELGARICVAGGIALLGAALSSMNYYTIGKDCNMIHTNNYCDVSLKLFYLTSSVCAIATIFAIGLSARYLIS